MAIRPSFAVKEIYHIYNRGTDKRNIFSDKRDYERFLALLFLCNSNEPVRIHNQQGRTLLELLEIDQVEPLVDIGAYCLMPNHFHLLLSPRKEGGVSKFMQKLVTGYTMYFNKRHERTGVLFQGKYKCSWAGEDRYLKYLLSYIHLNPKKYAEYQYSSYLDFIGTQRPQNKLINAACLPTYFDSPAEFKKELKDWASYREEFSKVGPR